MYINVAYFGYNDFRIFKRGVENVIISQSKSSVLNSRYYLFFGDRTEVFKMDNIICISISGLFIYKYILFNWILYKLKKRNVIIHSHNYVMSLFCFYHTDLFTVHDAIYYQRKENRDRYSYLFYWVEKIVYLRSRKLHFISAYALKQALISSRQSKAVSIIHNTTPFEREMPYSVNIEFDSDTFNLFAVRGIQKRTRIDLLIDFANYVKDKKVLGRKVQINIAGKGPLLDYYRQKIQEHHLQNVTLLGYIDDATVASYYMSCDMVIMPCEYAEGFGLPIIEGYYFNKPVIASNKCAVPEIICSNKYLFENTPTAIYDTLISVVYLNFDFRAYYEKRFSLQKMLVSISSIYMKLGNNE